MSFVADNGRIAITDQGQIVFDTDTPMPAITGIYEGQIGHQWAANDGTIGGDDNTYFGGFEYEARFDLAPLPSGADFVIAQVEPILPDPATASWVGEWPTFIPEGRTFFQGSAMVEILPSSEAAIFVRRLLHVYPDPNSRTLVAAFQHSSRFHVERGRKSVYSAHWSRFNLKAWYGSF